MYFKMFIFQMKHLIGFLLNYSNIKLHYCLTGIEFQFCKMENSGDWLQSM